MRYVNFGFTITERFKRLVNGEIGKLGPGTNMSGYSTYQELRINSGEKTHEYLATQFFHSFDTGK
jgi:hypothetical protein